MVTWRLNRALTFDRSGRHQGDEVLRYAAVTAAAQGTSYAVFTVLVLTVLAWLPQAALLDRLRGRGAVLLQRPPAGLVRSAAGALPHPLPILKRRPMSIDAEVCVIGAGPAGLTAAYCLTKERRSVLVLEKDPVYVGGISRTVSYKGFLSTSAAIASSRSRRRWSTCGTRSCPTISSSGRACRASITTANSTPIRSRPSRRSRNLGLFTSAACMLSYAWAKASPIAKPQSFHDWVRNQFGERLFQIFFKTYTEKVWGMSCDEISADWAAQRIKGLDLARRRHERADSAR